MNITTKKYLKIIYSLSYNNANYVHNKIMKDVLLFLSAFIPMYFLVLLKELIELITQNYKVNFLNILVIIFLICLISLGIIGIYLQINNKEQKSLKVKIIFAENITDKHFLGYFSLFVLFAITFDLSKISMLLVFVFIMIMIGIVYVKNKLFYINPFLNILGYNFYNIKYLIEDEGKQKSTKIFYRGELKINDLYFVKVKDENFSFIDNTKRI